MEHIWIVSIIPEIKVEFIPQKYHTFRTWYVESHVLIVREIDFSRISDIISNRIQQNTAKNLQTNTYINKIRYIIEHLVSFEHRGIWGDTLVWFLENSSRAAKLILLENDDNNTPHAHKSHITPVIEYCHLRLSNHLNHIFTLHSYL